MSASDEQEVDAKWSYRRQVKQEGVDEYVPEYIIHISAVVPFKVSKLVGCRPCGSHLIRGEDRCHCTGIVNVSDTPLILVGHRQWRICKAKSHVVCHLGK